MIRITARIITVVTALAPAATAAQVRDSISDTTTTVTQSAIGLSAAQLILPGGGGFSLGLVGVQFTKLREGKSGSELALYTAPAGVFEGAIVLVPKVSAVGARRIGPGWGIMKVGGEIAFAVNQTGGALIGLHAGMGLIMASHDDRWGFRIEIEPHISPIAPLYPVFLVNFGIVSLPKPAR